MRGIALCLSLIAATLLTGTAQTMQRLPPGKPIICYYSSETRPEHTGPSERFLQHRQQNAGRVKTANIEVEYINFPEKAKNAFQYAVEIWESALTSSVPIRVRARWTDLGEGVLGQALWGSAYSNFGEAQHQNIFYPVALAEKIARKELNLPTEPDIVASFNSKVSWYFELDGKTPAGKMDLVTIVLHEIAHGLGFSDSYSVEDRAGSVGMLSGDLAVPFIFDVFVENASGENLLHEFVSPSEFLASELQSTNLFFDGEMAVDALDGVRPELFAPSLFDNGSSVSHLDEGAFNRAADPNRLMTPQIAFAESVHDPGDLVMAMFKDMGWVYTHISHRPQKDTERMDGQPYRITAAIRSDNGYKPDQVMLNYTADGVSFTSVKMTPTGSADEFSFEFPGRTQGWSYAYFISVEDVENRVFTHPGKIQEPGKHPEQGMHLFQIGPDVSPPEITHEQISYIPDDETTLELTATITDNLGVAEVIIEYFIEPGAIQTAVMSKVSEDDYRATITLPVLNAGDGIEYRVIARDVATVENVASNPEDGFYMVNVTGIMPVRFSYVNDFNGPSRDFFGDNFGISTPAGFEDGAIHSDHPYPNGSGPNDESSYWYQLQMPIRIDNSNPVIEFDEIVLVEPGEDGSEFGDDDFFDYVVVEGSADGGVSWKPFAPGYDARDAYVWLSRYNHTITNFNSQAEGSPEWYRERRINMLENGNFSSGDEVLIRFRIFADQLARGWGWAIDNLSIQAPVTNTEKPSSTPFSVYPVPATRELFFELMPGSQWVMIEITDARGNKVFTNTFSASADGTRNVIDISAFAAGMYFLRAHMNSQIYFTKFIKHDR